MSEQKVYCNAAFFDEKAFDNGNSIIKVNSKNAKDLAKFVLDNANKDGSIRLVISRRKEVEEGKSSHYCYVDQWAPSNQAKPTVQPSKASKKSPPQSEDGEELI